MLDRRRIIAGRFVRSLLRLALLGAVMLPAALVTLAVWLGGGSPRAVMLPSLAGLALGMVASSLIVR
jgi:hypothetical protein